MIKNPLDILEGPISIYNIFQGGDDKRGYRNMWKIAGGSEPVLGH